MANVIYGEESFADKTPDKKLLAADEAMSKPVHPEIIPHDLVTPDQRVTVLSVIDEHGYATLGDCISALRPHDRPVATLIALAELGLIAFDRDADLDEHLSVWRIR